MDIAIGQRVSDGEVVGCPFPAREKVTFEPANASTRNPRLPLVESGLKSTVKAV